MLSWDGAQKLRWSFGDVFTETSASISFYMKAVCNLGSGTLLPSREIAEEGLRGEPAACSALGHLWSKCLRPEERVIQAQETTLDGTPRQRPPI